jgi:hypothetical protein
MPITEGTIKHVYNGNGTTRDWDYTFPINTTTGSDIKLYKTAINGTITEITTSYSINVTTKKVTYPTVISGLPLLATGEKITLLRVEPLSQASDWANQGPFNSETVEAALDKATMILQQLNEALSRCVKYPVDETPTSEDTDTFLALIVGYKNDAQAAQVAAAASAVAAAASESAAAIAETNAETAETNAETAETNAETAETNAEAAEVHAEDAAATALAQAGIATTKAGEAAASESNAAASESAAAASESAAAVSEANAATSETNAANYAAALKATSATSVAIEIGSKTFTTQADKQFAAGQFILVVDAASSANYMHGQVTSYSGTSLVVDVQDVGGSGTKTSWNIYVSGNRGAVGPEGDVAGDGSVGPNNLITNGDFDLWSAGTSAAPDGWTLEGGGAAVARDPDGKKGLYCAKLTRVGTNCQLYQDTYIAMGSTYCRNKTYILSAWVYASVANRTRIAAYNGTIGLYSSYHTGGGAWELLTIEFTVSAAATMVQVYCRLENGNTDVWFDCVMLTEGLSMFAFSEKPLPRGGTIAVDVDETKFSHKIPVYLDGATYYIMLTQT